MALQSVVIGQETPAIVAAKDLPRIVPTSFYFQGQSGPTQIHLLYAEAPTIPPEGHTAVLVDDYDGVFESLERAGFQPERRREHWGAPRSVVHDPAGHRVEVMAAPPPGI